MILLRENGKFCISEPDTEPNWVGSFGSALYLRRYVATLPSPIHCRRHISMPPKGVDVSARVRAMKREFREYKEEMEKKAEEDSFSSTSPRTAAAEEESNKLESLI